MSATAKHHAFDWTALGSAPSDVSGSAGDRALGDDLLAHLEVQLISARRMRHIVLEQASAIRRRAVRQVVATAGELQVEMHRRELIERDRIQLMERAAQRLFIAPADIGFTSILGLLDGERAATARHRTAELRGLLAEIDREHSLNQTLMTQELAFLDHLLGLAGGTGGYATRPANRRGPADGTGAEARRIRRNVSVVHRRVFDVEA